MFSDVCKVIKNQSSDFSSPLSTPSKVRKGRGSQKEETRCNHLSLIELARNFGELRTPLTATMKKWAKMNPTNKVKFITMSSDTAWRPSLK